MDDMIREQHLTLLSWSGPQTEGLGTVLLAFGTPGALFAADWHEETAKQRLGALPPATQRMLLRARKAWPRRNAEAPPSLLTFDPPDIFIPIGDPLYPPMLREVPDPPPWLFCRGKPACLTQAAVAVVGSRRASHGGLRAAQQISAHLASAGYVVCSGLALGIDAAAHRGALETGTTVAVLASGVDRPSPLRNQKLAEQIIESGCLVSELPAMTAPSKYQFPRRNRIISGLSGATIIVEAALPSGSLHTAASALEQGREVYTLPWSVFHEQGAGCRRLLRDGAVPITELDELSSVFPGVQVPPGLQPELPSGVAGTLLQLVGDDGLSLQALCQALGIPVPELLTLLSDLELQGWLCSIDGLYCRSDFKPCQR